MKTHIATLIIASLALPLVAEDAGAKGQKRPKGDPAKHFAKLDADSDSFISKEEFAKSPMAKKNAAKADAVFAKKDKDGDGKLSKVEFLTKPDGGKGKRKGGKSAEESSL